MELVFHKENGLYITEFEVTSDFNVHLERSKGGKVSFYQKTTDGNYDHIEKLSKNIDKVFDYDFQALVYPKIIKITSECEFDVASLTTDGEVTEIKSQSKEVEITSNGVTEIAPDAGFGYLSGVKVNVNVPTGGGDTPSGGGGEWKYIKADINDETASSLLVVTMFASLVKVDNGDGTKSVYPAAYQTSQLPDAKALALGIPWDAKIAIQGMVMKIGEYLSASGVLNALTFLSEEEFYNLTA